MVYTCIACFLDSLYMMLESLAPLGPPMNSASMLLKSSVVF